MPKTKTITELQKELKAKQGQLRKLRGQRSRAAGALAAIDRQIAALAGTGGVRATRKKTAGRKKAAGKKGAKKAVRERRRAKNKASLADVLAQVLKGKKGVKIADATKMALAAGYRSASKQFQTIVNQTLLRDGRFENVGRGRYALKGKKKAAAKKKATTKTTRKAIPGSVARKV